MTEARQKAAFLVGILGNAVAVLGVLQAHAVIAILGIGFSIAALSTGLASRKCSREPDSTVNVEGLDSDSLHLANLRRRLNTSLVVERAFHVAIIDGADLHNAWQYEGHCRSEGEEGIDFSIDAEHSVPFENLDCFAFDLTNDPLRAHAIRPALLGNDGASKKVRVGFLKTLANGDRFSVLLQCHLPGCITQGIQYYTASVSFDQQSIDSAGVHLMFVKNRPKWVRAYDVGKNGRAVLLHELRPFRDDGTTCEYIDVSQNIPGQSVRVYLYDLPPADLSPERRAA